MINYPNHPATYLAWWRCSLSCSPKFHPKSLARWHARWQHGDLQDLDVQSPATDAIQISRSCQVSIDVTNLETQDQESGELMEIKSTKLIKKVDTQIRMVYNAKSAGDVLLCNYTHVCMFRYSKYFQQTYGRHGRYHFPWGYSNSLVFHDCKSNQR